MPTIALMKLGRKVLVVIKFENNSFHCEYDSDITEKGFGE